MYLRTDFVVSNAEIVKLLREAHARTVLSKSSFMVHYPFVPDIFADKVVQKVQLVGLLPSQQIVAHVDAYLPTTRYHIALQTNVGCWVFHREQWQQLEIGQVYAMDPTVPHGAVNWGDTVRLHLMIDVEDV